MNYYIFSADGSQIMAAMGSTSGGEEYVFRAKLKSVLLLWTSFTLEAGGQLQCNMYV